jgi:hypothetical protein
MENQEWLNLGEALKRCLNQNGSLHYNYDARLAQMIEPCSPKNGNSFTRDRSYNTKGREETHQAIDAWVKDQQSLEDTVICTHAQLELEEDSEEARKGIVPRLIEEKKLLSRGVAHVNGLWQFPDWDVPRPAQAKALFDVAAKAIEIFQEEPTALVLFPELTIPDARVFGGFYGSPWSNFNNRTLRLKFRKLNPHFEIHVCTVWERGGFDTTSRKVGILFTYTKPW